MDKYVILCSEYNGKGISLPLNVQKIFWEPDNPLKDEYLTANLPHPSRFPSLVDTEEEVLVPIVMSYEDAFVDLTDAIDLKNADDEDKYKINRRIEYRKEGITAEAWKVAEIQNDVDGDSTELDALKVKRKEIRNRTLKLKKGLTFSGDNPVNIAFASHGFGDIDLEEGEYIEVIVKNSSSETGLNNGVYTATVVDTNNISVPFDGDNSGGTCDLRFPRISSS